MNVVPSPGADRTVSVPPCPSAIARDSASPSPVPGDVRIEPDADAEDALLLLGRDAVSGVGDRDPEHLVHLCTNQHQAGPGRPVLDCVRDEVVEHLSDA